MMNLDVYMATSLFFVLAAMFELALVLLVNRISNKKEMVMEGRISTGDRVDAIISNDIYHANDDDDSGINRTTGTIFDPWKLRAYIMSTLRLARLVDAFGKLRTTTKIDLLAFATFCTGFLVFNVIYYCTYHHK